MADPEMSDDLAACAGLVERGDPARFRAVMAAPPKARNALFPLYAFNVEVARVPWLTAEPGIAEIRLQWWIDALEEIAAGGMVRRHEVIVPLAFEIDTEQAKSLITLAEARTRDIYNDPFENEDELLSYLDDTSGRLLEVAVGDAWKRRIQRRATCRAGARYCQLVGGGARAESRRASPSAR